VNDLNGLNYLNNLDLIRFSNGERYYAALARWVVVRFSPTMKDGFTVHIV
jgi:hypothetical protein